MLLNKNVLFLTLLFLSINKLILAQPSKPNIIYGYMWCLNKKGRRHWEGVDENIFYAAGFGGNFIIIDKKTNTVVVTRWLEPSKVGEFMQILTKAFD